MKKYTPFILLSLLALLSGCSPARALRDVKARFPGAEVTTIPSSSKYLIRLQNGSVLMAESSGMGDFRKPNPELVIDVVELFPSK